jgi:hypothetical protein
VILGALFAVMFTGLGVLSHAVNAEPLAVGTLSGFIGRLILSWCTIGPVLYVLLRRQLRTIDGRSATT